MVKPVSMHGEISPQGLRVCRILLFACCLVIAPDESVACIVLLVKSISNGWIAVSSQSVVYIVNPDSSVREAMRTVL